jgi:hypothetical protein
MSVNFAPLLLAQPVRATTAQIVNNLHMRISAPRMLLDCSVKPGNTPVACAELLSPVKPANDTSKTSRIEQCFRP